MTVDPAPDYNATPATTSVAESLSNVGYAMFAWLQTGPLNRIPSITDFRARVHAEQELAPPLYPTYDADPEEGSAFGVADVNETMGAVTQPNHAGDGHFPLPDVPQPVGAVSAQYTPPTETSAVPAGQDSAVVPSPVPFVDASAMPTPLHPIEPVPHYTGKDTLAMLDEISFLDQ